MKQLQIFQFNDYSVRTIDVDHEPWFVAKDVCEILELSNPTMTLNRLDDDERAKFNLGRQGEANIVNESGLYELIFASRKEEARQFKRWVKREVLPAIRQTGGYQAPMSVEDMIIQQAESMRQVKDNVTKLESKVDNQITLDHGEQRRLQKAVSLRIYNLTQDKDERKQLFRQAYRDIKDRFGVGSYKDVKRKDLEDAVGYINHWIPKQVA